MRRFEEIKAVGLKNIVGKMWNIQREKSSVRISKRKKEKF